MKPKVAQSLLVAVGVLSLAAATAAVIINLTSQRIFRLTLIPYVVCDGVLAVLWVAGVGTAGKFLSDWKLWNANSKYIQCWKGTFALAFLTFFLFIASAVVAVLALKSISVEGEDETQPDHPTTQQAPNEKVAEQYAPQYPQPEPPLVFQEHQFHPQPTCDPHTTFPQQSIAQKFYQLGTISPAHPNP